MMLDCAAAESNAAQRNTSSDQGSRGCCADNIARALVARFNNGLIQRFKDCNKIHRPSAGVSYNDGWSKEG